MSSAKRALEAVRVAARARRDEALARWERSGSATVTTDLSDMNAALWTVGRLTVNFHPDRVDRSGSTVVEGMVRTGRYVSQWVTGISNGGRSAFPGGDRQRWEAELFAHSYADQDPATVDFPIYGAWDLLGDPHGGSPRFGSCFLVLADHVRERASICVGDSHAGPTDIGTFDTAWSVVAALAEQVDQGSLLGAAVGRDGLLALVEEAPVDNAPRRDLDHYVEMQVHGGVDLRADVECIVIDPSFDSTDVHRAVKYLWHTLLALGSDASRNPSDIGIGMREDPRPCRWRSGR